MSDAGTGIVDASMPFTDGGPTGDLGISTDGGTPVGADLYVLPGTGSLGFRSPIPYTIGGGPCALAVADLDGDNRADLAVSACDRSRVTVLTRAKGGPLTVTGAWDVGPSPSGIVAVDLDGDGRPDLATADAHGDSVSVLKNRGDATFDPALRIPSRGRRPVAIAAGDLDRDGKPDLAVADYDSNDVGVLLNTSK